MSNKQTAPRIAPGLKASISPYSTPQGSPLKRKIIDNPVSDIDSHTGNVNRRPDGPITTPDKDSPLSNRPRLQPQISIRPNVPLPVLSSPSVSTQTRPTSVNSSDCPVDYRLLLLYLADQYIAEARSLSTVFVQEEHVHETDRYYKLLALGLGCLEAVLKNKTWKLPPRQEATIQLRYARILHEETENDKEAEMTLSKGIGFCDQYRLLDLKYSMQHLLARILFKTSTRTSLKLLDNVIKDASTYKHKVWVYAFRFLRVSLSLQLSSQQEIHAALQNLRVISEIALKHGDKAISVTAAIFEALIHLHSRDVNSIVDAQRALATARAQQLDVLMKDVPQLNVLVFFLDLVCSLDPHDHQASGQKMQDIHNFLDNETCKRQISTSDDAFTVPIDGDSAGSLVLETGGVFSKSADGKDSLVFSWLARTDLYALGFLLSGAAVRHKNQSRGHETQLFLEGLKTINDQHLLQETCATDSVKRAFTRRRWTTTLKCYMLVQLTLAYCDREAWALATSSVEDLQKALRFLEPEITDTLLCFEVYLNGVILQGTGDCNAALTYYQNPSLALPQLKIRPATPLRESLAILAALNTLLLIRLPSHPAHHLVPPLLERLSTYNPASTTNNGSLSSFSENPHIASAMSFILSTLTNQSTDDNSYTTTSILLKKQQLQRALHLAKFCANEQLLTLCLSFLRSCFFDGIVGDQAIHNALTAQKMAKVSGNQLWICVADGMLAQTLELSGHTEQAAEVWEEGVTLKAKLPAKIRGTTNEDMSVGAGQQERTQDPNTNMDDRERV